MHSDNPDETDYKEIYQIDPKIYELKGYFDGRSALFKTYVYCPISDAIKLGKLCESYIYSIFDIFIDKNSVVVEGGSFIGDHSLKIASLCKTLYAFEPFPISCELLNVNLKLNDIHNVIVFNKGLSDSCGITHFAWNPSGNPGCSGLEDNPLGVPHWSKEKPIDIEVRLVSIDSLKLENLDFVKLDVEGYEEKVIKGGMNTIIRCKPVILLECWADHNGKADIDYAHDKFKDLIDIGYRIEQISGSDFLFLPE